MFKVAELIKATRGSPAGSVREAVIKSVSTDTRTIRPAEAFIALRGNNFDGHKFIAEAISKGAGCIIKETGVSLPRLKSPPIIEVKDTTRALADIARFHRLRFSLPVIAITGSNGKTSTKDMVAWVLSGEYRVLKNEGTKNNQIGLPLTLLRLNPQHDFAVLELGTNHFGEIGRLAGICLPQIAAITNIGISHLEHLHSPEGVFREKGALINKLRSPGIAILNADDAFLSGRLKKREASGFALGVGIKKRSDFSATDIGISGGRINFSVNKKYRFTLNTIGYYNIYNALIAIATARLFGMGYGDISRRIAAFDFPAGRLKLLKVHNTRFIDDTYNSNPTSLAQALDALRRFKAGGRKIFIMGDMLELGEKSRVFHSQAGGKAAAVCDLFLAVGELSRFAARAARAAGLKTHCIFSCATASEARDILFKIISPRPQDIVLVKGSRLMRMEEVFKKGKE